MALLLALCTTACDNGDQGNSAQNDDNEDDNDDDDDDSVEYPPCPADGALEATYQPEEFPDSGPIFSPLYDRLYQHPQPVLMLNPTYKIRQVEVFDWDQPLDAHNGFELPALADGYHCLRVEGLSADKGLVRVYLPFEVRSTEDFQTAQVATPPLGSAAPLGLDDGSANLPQWIELSNEGSQLIEGLRVYDGQLGDRSDIEAWVDQYTAGMSDSQAAQALYEAVTAQLRWGMVPELEGMFDPALMFNVFGYGWCGEQSHVLVYLWQIAGLDARVAYLVGHVCAEVYYDGGWHFFDPSSRLFFLDHGLSNVTSLETLENDSSLIYASTDPDERLANLTDFADHYTDLLGPPNGSEEPDPLAHQTVRHQLYPRESLKIHYSGLGASFCHDCTEARFFSGAMRREWQVLDPELGLAPLSMENIEHLMFEQQAPAPLHPEDTTNTGRWTIKREFSGFVLGVYLHAVIKGDDASDTVTFLVGPDADSLVQAATYRPTTEQQVYLDLGSRLDLQAFMPLRSLTIEIRINAAGSADSVGLKQLELVYIEQTGAWAAPAPHGPTDELIVDLESGPAPALRLGYAQLEREQPSSVDSFCSAEGKQIAADGRAFASLAYKLHGANGHRLGGGQKVQLVSNRGTADQIQRIWFMGRDVFSLWRSPGVLSPEKGASVADGTSKDWLSDNDWDLLYVVRSTQPGQATFSLEINGQAVEGSDVNVQFIEP
ncbi:MAG: transglutaminase domain-containing protein [Candidatus Alcyoniella australis]|nr:transglutaminase domain-containing protein [Candidatus Alcyoniella australis]